MKKEGCFVSQTERATYSKKLLDIQCRVEGMVLFSQNALFSILKKEFDFIVAEEAKMRGFVNGNDSSTSKNIFEICLLF